MLLLAESTELCTPQRLSGGKKRNYPRAKAHVTPQCETRRQGASPTVMPTMFFQLSKKFRAGFGQKLFLRLKDRSFVTGFCWERFSAAL